MAGAVSGTPATPAEIRQIIASGMRDAAQFVADEWRKTAKYYAPVSPTEAEAASERLAKSKRKGKATKRRKVTQRRRRKRKMGRTPGGLEKSIASDVEQVEGIWVNVSAYVADPSPAKKYAEVIHDKKGIRWKRRGIGTRNKGKQADEKFIYRAAKDREREFFEAFKQGVDMAVQASGKTMGALQGGSVQFMGRIT